MERHSPQGDAQGMTRPELPRQSAPRRLLTALRVHLAPGSVLGATCLRCDGEFMAPEAWDPADGGYWRLIGRCTQCDVWRTLMLSGPETARLLVRIDQQRTRMARVVARLDRERMLAQVEAFAEALQRDLIAATDFGI